jgi:prepilin-type N-terminal cleavage/methylation domain-containing protein
MEGSEKGFTLVEMIVTAAIIGIIMAALATTVTALLTHPEQATDHNIVLCEVQNAGYWITRDVQMARNVTLDDPSGFPLTFNIPVDTDENNDLSVDYLFDGNELKRQVYDSLDTLISETVIAKYIDVADTAFGVLESNAYKLTIKASKGEAVVERSYEVSQRLTSS